MTPSNSSRVLFSPEEGRTRGKEPVNVQETNSKKEKKKKKKRERKKKRQSIPVVFMCAAVIQADCVKNPKVL